MKGGKKFITTPTFVESPPFRSKTPQLSRKNRLLSLTIRPQKASTLRRNEMKEGNNYRKPMKPPLYARVRALSQFRFCLHPSPHQITSYQSNTCGWTSYVHPHIKTHILLFDLYNINTRKGKGEGYLGWMFTLFFTLNALIFIYLPE